MTEGNSKETDDTALETSKEVDRVFVTTLLDITVLHLDDHVTDALFEGGADKDDVGTIT